MRYEITTTQNHRSCTFKMLGYADTYAMAVELAITASKRQPVYVWLRDFTTLTLLDVVSNVKN